MIAGKQRLFARKSSIALACGHVAVIRSIFETYILSMALLNSSSTPAMPGAGRLVAEPRHTRPARMPPTRSRRGQRSAPFISSLKRRLVPDVSATCGKRLKSPAKSRRKRKCTGGGRRVPLRRAAKAEPIQIPACWPPSVVPSVATAHETFRMLSRARLPRERGFFATGEHQNRRRPGQIIALGYFVTALSCPLGTKTLMY